MSARVSVDIEDLAFALSSHDIEYYLDLHTGDVFPWFEDSSEDDEELAVALEETPDRFVLVDPIPSHEGYGWMESFADDQPDGAVREALLDALDRPKPFRNFKDTLLDYPEVREEWFKVEEQRVLEYARAWLESEGIDVNLVSKRKVQIAADAASDSSGES